MKRNLRYAIFILIFSVISIVGFSDTDSISSRKSSIPNPNASKDDRFLWSKSLDYPIDCIVGDNTYLYTSGLNKRNATISKWNKNGQLIWERQWRDTLSMADICVTDNFVIWAGLRNTVDISTANFINVMDKNGEDYWARYWAPDNSSFDQLNDMWVDDQGIFITGMRDINRIKKVVLLKWEIHDSSNVKWLKEWNYTRGEWGTSLWGDEEYLYVGGQDYWTNHGLLMKWDKNGNLIWDKTIVQRNDSWPVVWGGVDDIWGDETALYTFNDQVIDSPGEMVQGWQDASYLMKWDKNGSQIWNYTNFYLDSLVIVNSSPKLRMWGDTNYLYTCEAIVDTFILSKFDKEGVLTWNATWNKPEYEGFSRFSIWGDKKYLYSCADNYMIKWENKDLESNVPLLIGTSSGIVCIVIVGSLVVLKPLKRIHQRRMKRELVTIRNNLNSLKYDNTQLFENTLAIIETHGTIAQKNEWLLLKKKQDLNSAFQTRLQDVLSKKMDSRELAYNKLGELLHNVNIPEYAEIIDRQLVSDITEALKNVSDKIT